MEHVQTQCRGICAAHSWLPFARDGTLYENPSPRRMEAATRKIAASTSSSTASASLSTTCRA